MKICPQCRDSYMDVEGNYCHKDGAKLLTHPQCVCGRQTLPYFKFCPACGVAIVVADPTKTVQPESKVVQ